MSEFPKSLNERVVIREAISTKEKELTDELQSYKVLRSWKLSLIDAALNEGGFDVADNILFFKELKASVDASFARSFSGGSEADDEDTIIQLESLAQAMRNHSTGKISRHQKQSDQYQGLIAAVKQQIEEVRLQRRVCINELRKEISENNDLELLKEICILLEEDINSSWAHGDHHEALAASATLEIFADRLNVEIARQQAKNKKTEQAPVEPVETIDEAAADKVRHLIMSGDIHYDDRVVITRRLKEGWLEASSEEEREVVLKDVLRNYRASQRAEDRKIEERSATASIDPKSMLIDPKKPKKT